MKKLMILAAVGIAVCGCQTRVTWEKYPEVLKPYYGLNGTNTYVKGFERATGGYYVTARSPLWADEALKGLSLKVSGNDISFDLESYSRDLSTNAVTMAHNLMADFAVLAEKAIAAYGTCGASIATAEAKTAVQKAIASYILKGGNAANTQATATNGANGIKLSLTDGNVTEICSGGACNPVP